MYADAVKDGALCVGHVGSYSMVLVLLSNMVIRQCIKEHVLRIIKANAVPVAPVVQGGPCVGYFLQKVRHQLGPFFTLGSVDGMLRFAKEFEALGDARVAFIPRRRSVRRRRRRRGSLFCCFSFGRTRIRVAADFEYGRHIAAPVTIVGRAPNRHETVVKMILATFHDQLVSTGNQM